MINQITSSQKNIYLIPLTIIIAGIIIAGAIVVTSGIKISPKAQLDETSPSADFDFQSQPTESGGSAQSKFTIAKE